MLSPRQSLRDTCIGAQFDQLKMIWEICEFSFIIVQQVSLHSLIGPRRLIIVDISVGITMVSELL